MSELYILLGIYAFALFAGLALVWFVLTRPDYDAPADKTPVEPAEDYWRDM